MAEDSTKSHYSSRWYREPLWKQIISHNATDSTDSHYDSR